MDDGRPARRAGAAILVLIAPFGVLGGLWMAPVIASIFAADPGLWLGVRIVRAGLVAGVGIGLGGIATALTVAGAVGAWRGGRWGWSVGLAVAALWVPTGCGCAGLLAFALIASAGPATPGPGLVRPHGTRSPVVVGRGRAQVGWRPTCNGSATIWGSTSRCRCAGWGRDRPTSASRRCAPICSRPDGIETVRSMRRRSGPSSSRP